MTSPFDGLKPELIWSHFHSLTKIPRCSGNEAQAARHVSEWATSRGYETQQDKLGNLVVRVPATSGKESAPTVVLQGHLDMVGEKDSSSPHDFAKDPIPVIRDGGYLTADGTTLGADNGIGLAAGMAVSEDPGAVHGPLELLFTVDEETGLTGAQGLEPGFVTGKTLINMDSEEEGAVYVGCAGGVDTVIELPVSREAAGGDLHGLTVSVTGLKGGHSGLDINTGRGNAIQVLAWFLDRLRRAGTEFELAGWTAGDKHNAIPREGTATILLSTEGKAAAEELVAPFSADLQTLYDKTDPGVTISLETVQPAAPPLSRSSRDALLDLLLAMPHGVVTMSQAVEGLVETSTNLAVVKLETESSAIEQSSRSSVMPALAGVQAGLFALARLAGATPASRGGYPGWQPDMDSEVLRKAIDAFERLFGRKPAIKAIHAGLECGIIGEKMGGMDMVSFGPQIENPHSPSEQLKIDSVPQFYDHLKALLAELAG
jgi:dipeptidase D